MQMRGRDGKAVGAPDSKDTEQGGIICKGGRATMADENPSTVQRRTVQRAGPRSRSKKTYPIESASLSMLERCRPEVVPWWRALWDGQVEWEQAGGRSLSWAIRDHLCWQGGLESLFTDKWLTSHPSFDWLALEQWPQATVTLVMLCELGEAAELAWWLLTNQTSELQRWTVVVRSLDLTRDQHSWLNRHGSQGYGKDNHWVLLGLRSLDSS
jgi:hypothetical protein